MGILNTQNKVLMKEEVYEASVRVVSTREFSFVATNDSFRMECGSTRPRINDLIC